VLRKLTALLTVAALATAVAAGAGCGGDDNGVDRGNSTLSPSDNLKVAQDRADIEEFCALAPVGKGDLYDRAFFSVVSAVDQLILIYKNDTNGVYYEPLKKDNIKMKDVVNDAARKLNSCGKDGKQQAGKLTQAQQAS